MKDGKEFVENAKFTKNQLGFLSNMKMKKLNHENQLVSTNIIIKKFARKSIPLIISGFVGSAEELIHTCMITHLGENALAADAIFDATNEFFLDTSTALLDPVTAMVGQSFGRKEFEKIGQIVQQGWLLGAVLSIPAMMGLYFTTSILKGLGQSDEVALMVDPYAKAACLAIPPFLSLNVDRSFLKAINKENDNEENDNKENNDLMRANIFTVGTSAGIAYILMFGKLGFSAFGVAGVGYAFTAQCWMTFSIYKHYLYRRNEFKQYSLFKPNFKTLNYFKKSITLGMPIFLLTLGKLGTNFILTAMSGWYGIESLAISKAVSIYSRFLKEPGNKIGQVSQVFVAQYKGAEDYINMRRFGKFGVMISAGVNAIPLFIFCSFPKQLASVFINEQNLEEYESFIRMIFVTKALTQFFESIQEAFSENLKGLFDTFYPSILQLLTSLTITLPLSYLLGYVYDGRLVGMEASVSIGSAITLPFLYHNWKHASESIHEKEDSKKEGTTREILPMYRASKHFPKKESLKEERTTQEILPMYRSLKRLPKKKKSKVDSLNVPKYS